MTQRWIYHKTKEPKLIDSDKPTPKGWADTPAKFKK